MKPTNAPQSLKMTKVMLMIVLFMVFLGSVEALAPLPENTTYCYQETANSSNVNDKYCSLVYTGGYDFKGSIVNNMSSIDANWLTYSKTTAMDGSFNISINYTKPLYASNGSIWEVKYGVEGVSTISRNLSIPEPCFNANATLLQLKILIYNSYPVINLTCFNSTGFQTIYSSIIINQNGYGRIFEERIKWASPSIIENNQSYNTSVITSSSNEFKLNISYDDVLFTSMNAYLIYNNTIYSSNKAQTGNNIIFSTSTTAPYVTNITNIPFYWNIQANNGTETFNYNTSSINQSIIPFKIGVCNATFTKVIVNFSNFDETTRARLLSPTNNNTYNVDLRLGSPSLNEYTYISVNSTSNSLAICFNETIVSPLRLDYVVQYTSSGHTSEYYFVQNFTLTNQTLYNNVSLYPLLTTSSQEFLIKVKNENFLSITGAVVEIYRKYVELGQYVLVEAPITDSLGQTIGHLVKNDVIYTIVVKKNGQTLNTYNDIQVYCNTLTQECILNLNPYGTSTQPSSFIDYRGVSYTARYDDSTQLYEVEFTSTNGSSRNMSIYAWILDNTQNVSVCSNIVSGVTGTLSCSLSTAEGKTALINVYVDGNLLFSDYVRVGFEKNDIMDNIRYILLAFLIPFFVMFALSSGSLAIIFYILGIIFGIGIYALDTQSFIGAGSFLIWFIVAGIILIIKIMRGGVKNG